MSQINSGSNLTPSFDTQCKLQTFFFQLDQRNTAQRFMSALLITRSQYKVLNPHLQFCFNESFSTHHECDTMMISKYYTVFILSYLPNTVFSPSCNYYQRTKPRLVHCCLSYIGTFLKERAISAQRKPRRRRVLPGAFQAKLQSAQIT